MRKISSLVMAAVILTATAAGLSGCGEKKIETLKWIQLGDRPEKNDKIMEKVNEIVEPELGMKVEVEYLDSASFGEKTKMKMASGESFDVIWTGYINDYQATVTLGGLLDITDYLDNIKMADGSTVKMSDAVETYFLDAAEVNGRIYGIPNTQVVSNPLSYMMPKALADECDIDLDGLQEVAAKVNSPETAKAYIEKLTAEMDKVHEKRPDIYTVNPSTNPASRNVYEEIVAGVGIRKDGSSTKVLNIKSTEEFICGVDATRTWYEKDFVRTDIASKGNNPTSIEEKKQYAFLQTTWKPGQDVQDAKDFGEEIVYSWIEEPYVPRTNPLATMLCVGKDAKHPEEAVKFIYMLNSNKELYNLVCWGIENEDYIKNADGTITEIENSGYDNVGSGAWKYGNQFNSYIYEGQPSTVWDDTKAMNDNAKKSPAMGFVPDTDPISTEIANIANVNAEYKARYEFGTAPRSEYWDEYMQKLNDAGIEKVCTEIQKQYDEFVAGK